MKLKDLISANILHNAYVEIPISNIEYFKDKDNYLYVKLKNYIERFKNPRVEFVLENTFKNPSDPISYEYSDRNNLSLRFEIKQDKFPELISSIMELTIKEINPEIFDFDRTCTCIVVKNNANN